MQSGLKAEKDNQASKLHGGNQRVQLEEETESSLKWGNSQDLRVDGGEELGRPR